MPINLLNAFPAPALCFIGAPRGRPFIEKVIRHKSEPFLCPCEAPKTSLGFGWRKGMTSMWSLPIWLAFPMRICESSCICFPIATNQVMHQYNCNPWPTSRRRPCPSHSRRLLAAWPWPLRAPYFLFWRRAIGACTFTVRRKSRNTYNHCALPASNVT